MRGRAAVREGAAVMEGAREQSRERRSEACYPHAAKRRQACLAEEGPRDAAGHTCVGERAAKPSLQVMGVMARMRARVRLHYVLAVCKA